MCGLFGAYGTHLGSHDIEVVKQLGIISQLRGTDSTGLCVLSRHKGKIRYQIRRDVGDSTAFLEDERTEAILDKTPAIFGILGHTRYATSGVVNVFNAHPISEKNVIGCHNGVIRKFDPPKHEAERNTDSRVLFRKIAEQGLQGAVNEVGYEGAYALTFVDLEEMTFNITRNSQRTLYLMFNNRRDAVFWASEKEMLELVSVRAPGVYNPVFPVAANALWKFKLGAHNLDPVVSKLEPVFPPKVYTPNTSTKGAAYAAWWSDQEIAERTSTAVAPSILKPGSTVPLPEALISVDGKPLYSHYKGYGEEKLPITEAAKIMSSGCAFCTNKPKLNEPAHWVDDKVFVCGECHDHNELAQELISQTLCYKGELCN